MPVEYQGNEIIYAIEIPGVDPNPATTVRPFNQTSGSSSIEADTIDLDTKDKSGSDYGKVTESVSLEGILTEGDTAVNYLKTSIRNKTLVKIYEIDTRTLKADSGMYMLSKFEKGSGNGDFATYSVEGKLNGDITTETLTAVPAGAPA